MRRVRRENVTEVGDYNGQPFTRHVAREVKDKTPLLTWKTLTAIALVVISLSSTIGFAEFMFEEAAQQAGFGTFQCANAVRGAQENETIYMVESICEEQFSRALAVARQGKQFTMQWGWLMPLNWESYKAFFTSAEASIQVQYEIFHTLGSEQEAKLLKQGENQTWRYEYKTIQIDESNVKLINQTLAELSAEGWHVKESYTAKIGAKWYLILIMERIILPV